MDIMKYIWSNKKTGSRPLTKSEYYDELVHADEGGIKKADRAFEKAWETRNFEIEMYWKRANYFWAFIASTFVGYFALVGSDNYKIADKFAHVEVYILVCIGFVLSFAWFLTNIGSKTWQNHWETHIDLLESNFTGPLYKTVLPTETFSVSKINEIVSFMFIIIWALLGVKYLYDNNLIRDLNETYSVNWFVIVTTVLALLLVISMIKGHGRGRFGEKVIVMSRRSVIYQTSSSRKCSSD